jgi:hypothetical protein
MPRVERSLDGVETGVEGAEELETVLVDSSRRFFLLLLPEMENISLIMHK